MKEESEKASLKPNIQKTKITASAPIILWQQIGKEWKQQQILFSWAQKSLQMATVAMRLRCLLFGRKAMTNLDRILKS